MSARWAAAKGEGAPLCTLHFSSHQELADVGLMGPDPTVVSSVLTCGERTVTHELLKAAPRDSAARVADGLAAALATAQLSRVVTSGQLAATPIKCLPEPNWPTIWLRKAANPSGCAPMVEVFARSHREKRARMSATPTLEDIEPQCL